MGDQTVRAESGKTSRASRTRVIANSGTGLVTNLVTVPIALLVSAFVVHKLGIRTYGVWATLTMLVAYGGLLDLGMATPIVKFAAEFMARGEDDEVNRLTNTAMVVYFSAGLLFFASLAIASPIVLSHIFHVSSSDTAVRQIYFAVLGGFVLTITCNVFQGVITGSQRADVVAWIGLLATVVSYGTTVLALLAGLGLRGLAISWLASTATLCVGSFIAAKVLFPPLRVNPLLFSVPMLRRIFGFAVRVQAETVSLTLNDQVDRMLIAIVLGPAPLGFYNLASRVAAAIRGVSFSVMAGVLAAASDLATVGDQARLRSLFLRSTRYLAIADFGAIAFVGSLALPLVHAWLGAGYRQTALTLIVILAGYAVWLPNQPATEVLNGLGMPGIRMRADLAFLAVHLPLSILLIHLFGYYGTVVGTSVALSTTRLYVYVRGARLMSLGTVHFFKSSLAGPALAALAACGAAITPQLVGLSYSLSSLVGESLLFVLVYAGGVWIVALSVEDRAEIKNLRLVGVKRAQSRAEGVES